MNLCVARHALHFQFGSSLMNYKAVTEANEIKNACKMVETQIENSIKMKERKKNERKEKRIYD